MTVILLYCSLTSAARYSNLVFYCILRVACTICFTCDVTPDWLPTFSLAPVACAVTMFLYSWTLISLDTLKPYKPEPLYTWTPESLVQYSCGLWLYIIIIINNLYRVGENCWIEIQFHIYDGLIDVARLHSWGIIWRLLVVMWGVLTPLPLLFFLSFQVCTSPRPISMGFAILYSCSGDQ